MTRRPTVAALMVMVTRFLQKTYVGYIAGLTVHFLLAFYPDPVLICTYATLQCTYGPLPEGVTGHCTHLDLLPHATARTSNALSSLAAAKADHAYMQPV